MAFGKARKMVRHAKISLRGTLKSGKTTSAAMLAAYIAKKHHPGKPVSFVPTEPGIDFTLNIFATEGLEVIEPVDAKGIPLRSRDYMILKTAIPDAIAAGAGVLLVDNLTHFREDLVRAHKINIGAIKFKDGVKVLDRKLKPFEYTPINEEWSEFTAQMTAAPLDIIVLGRLGKIFEELENEEGESDIHQVGNKMKAGSDTEYEVDLIAEMESRPDPDFANAEKVPVLGPADNEGNRKVKRRKLVRKFEQRNIHVFTVAGCRVWALNGQSLTMKSASAYKKGMCDQIGNFCAPYLDFLKSGDDIGGSPLNLGPKSEQKVFPGQGENNGTYVRKQKTLERFKTTMDIIFPDRSVLTKQRRMFVGEQVTNGIRSPKEFAAQDADALDFQYLILQKFEQRLKQEGMPDTLEPGLKYLTDLARLEAEEDWKVFHPAVQPLTSEQEAEEAEMPF